MSVFRRLAAACAVLSILSLPLRSAPAAAQGDSATAWPQVRTLANGLRVVAIEDHAAPVVQVQIWYRFGALEETPGKTGLAHALEHMMFRGTRDLSAAGLDDMTARLGAEVNAQTEMEDTHFFMVVPADRMETVLRVEADRMRNLKLAPQDWDLERGAVLQEWDQDHGNPTSDFLLKVGRAVYGGSRLGDNPLGVKADIEHATVADLRHYYDEWYRPNDATLVVTGDVHAADVFAAAQRWFGGIPAAPLPARRQYAVRPAHGVTIDDAADYPFTIVDEAYATPGDAPATEHDQLDNDVALGALFDERGPMQKDLVESGLALAVDPISLEDRRASVVHVLLVVAPGHTADEVRAAYEKTMASLLSAPLDRDYIAATKRRLVTSLLYARDSIVGLGDDVGGAEVFPGDTDPSAYAAFFNSADPAQVDAEARAIYAHANVVAVMHPRPQTSAPASAPTVSASVNDNFAGRVAGGPVIQPAWLRTALAQPLDLHSRVDPIVTTLPNGLRLLVQRVPENPTVFIAGQLRDSPTFDPPGKEGTGELVSEMLGKGSVRYDEQAQRKLGDDLAAELDFGTSFQAHGRAADAQTLLNALADDLEHPAFPADAFARARTQAVQLLAERRRQAGYVAQRAFDEALYPPGDPALRRPTPSSLAGITLDDVKAYDARYVRPDLTTLVVVGDVDPGEVQREVAAAFGGWHAQGPAPDPHLPPLPLPEPQQRRIPVPIDDVAVMLGAPAAPQSAPDYDALVLANEIYGGGSLESRLFQQVRQDRGLVYTIGSQLRANQDRGMLLVSFRATAGKVDAADHLVREELRSLQTAPPAAGELASAKTRVVATVVDAEQATATIASDLLSIGAGGFPTDYYATLPQRFAKIDAEQVREAAVKWFHPNHLVEVRAGA